MVDRAALEMRCTGNCTGGSNPSLSAEARDSSGQNPQDQCLADFFCVLSSRILPLSGAGRTARRTAGYPSPEESRIRGADQFGAV